MATYWVSQERYYCKYCKVWLSNHQAVSQVFPLPILTKDPYSLENAPNTS